MKTAGYIRDLIAEMEERDKAMRKQFEEELRKKFPPDIEFPPIDLQPDIDHVNCRCTMIPCTERKENPE